MSVNYTFLIAAVKNLSSAYGEDVADMASHIKQLEARIAELERPMKGTMDLINKHFPPKEVAMKTPNLTPNSRNKKAPPEEVR